MGITSGSAEANTSYDTTFSEEAPRYVRDEHKTEERQDVISDEDLKLRNEKDGWELVSFTYDSGGWFGEKKYIYHFKRPANFLENKERMREKHIDKVNSTQTNVRSAQTRLWAALSHYRPDLFERYIYEESFDRVFQRVFDEVVGRKRAKEELKYVVGIRIIIEKLIKDKNAI